MAVSFHLEVYAAGVPDVRRIPSSSGGAKFDHGHASFHTMALLPASPGLDFELKALFHNAADELKETGWVKNAHCPPYGIDNSRFIQAIAVKLSGPDSAKYKVDYHTRVTRRSKTSQTTEYWGDSSNADGEYAGITSPPDARYYYWISEFTVRVSPR